MMDNPKDVNRKFEKSFHGRQLATEFAIVFFRVAVAKKSTLQPADPSRSCLLNPQCSIPKYWLHLKCLINPQPDSV